MFFLEITRKTDEPIGASEGQRMPDHQVREAEDDDGAADAYRERRHDQRDQRQLALPSSDRDAEILQHVNDYRRTLPLSLLSPRCGQLNPSRRRTVDRQLLLTQ